MDFLTIKVTNGRGNIVVYPDFKICHSKDLMVKGSKFYAIWDEEAGLWSTDLLDVQRLIDKELDDYVATHSFDNKVKVKYLASFNSQMWTTFLKYVSTCPDSYKLLDRTITFADTPVKKSDYISRKLSYTLNNNPIPAYEELTDALYSPEQKEKFEWIIGSIIAGDSRKIQKFLVFYGKPGTGKSTILNIIQKMFDGYYNSFSSKALGSSNSEFSIEPFRLNPLIAIEHEGDLSRIEDNTRLNSITSHEPITVNLKHKSMYTDTFTSMCIIGTNKPVKITDSKSGIIRRLIDVNPRGVVIPTKKYDVLMGQIDFELGGIAKHCLDVYTTLGKNYYKDYKPIMMMQKTDVFFNYIQEYFIEYSEDDELTLKKAWSDYLTFCNTTNIKYDMPQYRFREELKEYFNEFHEQATDKNGMRARSLYKGFKKEKIYSEIKVEKPKREEKQSSWLELNKTTSLLDKMLADCPAQFAKEDGTPITTWGRNTFTLKDLNTKELHYVKPPLNHIVIDFDLKNDKGEKDFALNLEAVSKWPKTYAELSKSGAGIHLHYIYEGDVEKLASIYDVNIEVKVFKGRSSLRRKLSKCNDIPVAIISSGLPLLKKAKDAMIEFKTLKNEAALDTYIRKCLNKEYPPHATKPMIDYIYDSLEKAYASGMDYDMSKWYSDVMFFAQNSTHNADYCVRKVVKMKWKSKSCEESEAIKTQETYYEDDRIAFFDIEVFPNLLLIVWKFNGADRKNVMINPTPEEVRRLLKLKLVGFNCRRYDNHIVYAAASGFSVKECYGLSKQIIKQQKGFIVPAYNVSYADIYDYSTVKQSLKRFEIDLGMHHQELPLDWNKDVPDDKIDLVVEYCCNDVDATEAVFNDKDRKADFDARCIIAKLSNSTPNDTTRVCAERFIFGDDRNPQQQFNYYNLAEEFPGYEFKNGISTYMGEMVGEGGYVYAEPGAYGRVICLDVRSMHPHSIKRMNLFGKYTVRFNDLIDARVAVKHGDKKAAEQLLDGMLLPYMENEDACKKLSYALKIVINSVYGLTCASFANRFRDPRNIDNIVAKRGALFMCTLKHKVQEIGYKVVHIKTDSIKIAEPDSKVVEFINNFGNDYGYAFEIEDQYERILLVNDAVYVAKNKEGKWEATGAEFKRPFVFKTLFSKEPIEFKDLCETKQVQTEIYLDFNEDNPEKHLYHFVGKVGSFIAVRERCGGGILYRKVNADDNIPVETWLDEEAKMASVTGTKGYRWKEAELIKNDYESQIDMSYYRELAEDAKKHVQDFIDFDQFTSEDNYIVKNVVYSKNQLNGDTPVIDLPFEV